MCVIGGEEYMKSKKILLVISILVTILNIIPLAYNIDTQSLVGIIFGLIGVSAGTVSTTLSLVH